MSMTAAEPSSAQSASHECSVVMIGTEATGKTVLITTLAARFGRDVAEGLFLIPSDNRGATFKYVSRNWEKLTTGQWPPLTKRGELFELEWTVQESSTPVASLRMIDVSGEDLRLLFDDGLIDEPDKLSGVLRRVAAYFRDAAIILVLIDLDDFVTNRESEHVRQTQWVINYALKRATETGNEGATALVFTKIDRYDALIQSEGGLEGVVRKYLPLVYGNHVVDGRLSVLSVAAVADTRVDTSSGQPRSVPAPHFTSRGLDTLVNWIHGRASEIRARQQAQVLAEQERELRRLRGHRRWLLVKSLFLALLIGLVAQIITLPILCFMCRDKVTTQAPVTESVPRTVDHPGHWWLLWLDGRTETVYDTVTKFVDKVTYVVNTPAVAICDLLLTALIVLIAWSIKYRKLSSASHSA